ncbi:MAG: glutamine-hydrolyzing GMP synthase [Candidatus Thorarchaeota archaeon]|jgi:GMP synthase (glutamine-hydrolysing)
MAVGERVLVVDYGGQYTHLIARRCRELGVYAEIVPQETEIDVDFSIPIKGVILSGGPRTVSKEELGNPFDKNMALFRDNEIQVLGICFGHQLLALANGGKLEAGGNPEYGSIPIDVNQSDSILSDLENGQRVWMSHSDQVAELPDHFVILATSSDGHIAAFEDRERSIFGVQFHPEVYHTKNGTTVLEKFLRQQCKFKEHWTPESLTDDIIASIQQRVGDERVLMGTSGGVDSTVAAYLIQRAIGDRLYCVFVDNGLLREGEREEVSNAFAEIGFENFVVVDASEEFLDGLDGIEDPEEKRKIIADTFIRVFERKAEELESEYGVFKFLGQGTIYPDRVESAATGKATAVIKSHHNVRLPDWMKLKLVEPLGELYKDEVRKVGDSLGIPTEMIQRQPFPGPSLAIRIGGPVNRKQLSLLRQADTILQEELQKDPIYPDIWQSFCVLLPVKSVGVMGDERTYDQAVVIRIVESLDAMTASVSRPSWDILLDAASRIANEVKGINRVVYDLTSKPPGTIEWY